MNHCRAAMAHRSPVTAAAVADLAMKQAGAERAPKTVNDSSPAGSATSSLAETLRGAALTVSCIAGFVTALLFNNFHWGQV